MSIGENGKMENASTQDKTGTGGKLPREGAPDLASLATAFRRAVYRAWTNTLIGQAPPDVRKTFEQMKYPEVGDWVIEASTIHGMRHSPASDLDGVGVLEEVAQEKIDFGDPDFVWDEAEEGRPHPVEPVFYIRTIDGRRFRWTNATILAAPKMSPPL